MPCTRCLNDYTPDTEPSTERTASAVSGICVGCFAALESCTWHETLPYYAVMPEPGLDRENVLLAWVGGSAEEEDWEFMAEMQPEALAECVRWCRDNAEEFPPAMVQTAKMFGMILA